MPETKGKDQTDCWFAVLKLLERVRVRMTLVRGTAALDRAVASDMALATSGDAVQGGETAFEGTPVTAQPAVLPPVDGEPPYLGLQRFTEAEADRFFGRERLTARILERWRTEPFLAVIGASGSGKSSLVRAGLVPQFRSNGEGCDVRLLTPTSRPLDALSVALLGRGTSESNYVP